MLSTPAEPETIQFEFNRKHVSRRPSPGAAATKAARTRKGGKGTGKYEHRSVKKCLENDKYGAFRQLPDFRGARTDC
ncbi:MAG: hypothetical protein K8R10_12485 [Rhodocyclales bacterium]|jgi:hypothetical protein|nr:hypothetical protein [Rhodocyclales bacterium]